MIWESTNKVACRDDLTLHQNSLSRDQRFHKFSDDAQQIISKWSKFRIEWYDHQQILL
jgi:hypothetical protein